MTIIVNGEHKEVTTETLSELVAQYQLDENLIVTEVDGLIIHKDDRSHFQLTDGMRVEIVQFVGGG